MKESKTQLQNVNVQKLIQYKNLLLHWGTGTGKSRVAVIMSQWIIDHCCNPDIIIFVAESSNKDNWIKEFHDALGNNEAERILPYVKLECYASIHKYKGSSFSFICFDEAHHIKSQKRQEIVETMHSDYVLALSATLSEASIDILSYTFGRFEIDEIPVQDAIDRGFLPEPKIICIQKELEKFQRTEILTFDFRTKKSGDKGILKDLYGKRWKYLRNRKGYRGFVIELSCTEKEKYEYLDSQYKYLKRQHEMNPDNIRIRNSWLQAGSKRKRFLGELKTENARKIVDKLRKEHKRFICFCSSIQQAQSLGPELSIHSKNSMSSKIIRDFNEGKTNELFAVGMLQEGQNLKDIQAGIIIQLDGEERGFIQKSGRIMRSRNPEIYILYFKDTKDEYYFQNAIDGINEKYLKHI